MHQTASGRLRPPGCARRGGRINPVFFLLLAAGVPTPLAGQAPGPRMAYERVIAAVRARSPWLAAARADLDAARARTRAAGRAPATELSADVEEAPAFRMGEAVYTVALAQEFPVGGRGNASRAVAAADAATAEEALAWWGHAVGVEAERELTRWLGWSAIARRLAAQDSLLARAEVALRDRLSAGEARYADVLRMATERLRSASERNLAVTAAGEARARLEAMAGGADTLLSAVLDSLVAANAIPARPPDPPSPDSLLSLAPSVRGAAADVRRLAAEREAVRAETRPRLRASLGLQVAGEGERRGVGPLGGVALSLPFTAGGANRAALAAAATTTDAAEARLTAVRAHDRGLLDAAARRFHAAVARAALFEAGLLAAARAERTTALDTYAGGEVSLIEFLDFERAAAQTEIDALHALMDVTEAWAGLWPGLAPEGEAP